MLKKTIAYILALVMLVSLLSLASAGSTGKQLGKAFFQSEIDNVIAPNRISEKPLAIERIRELKDSYSAFKTLRNAEAKRLTEVGSDAVKRFEGLEGKKLSRLLKTGRNFKKFEKLDKKTLEKISSLSRRGVKKFSRLSKENLGKVRELDKKDLKAFEELDEKKLGKLVKVKNFKKFRGIEAKNLWKIGNLNEKDLIKFDRIKAVTVKKLSALPKEKLKHVVENFSSEQLDELGELKEEEIEKLGQLDEKQLKKVAVLRKADKKRVAQALPKIKTAKKNLVDKKENIERLREKFKSGKKHFVEARHKVELAKERLKNSSSEEKEALREHYKEKITEALLFRINAIMDNLTSLGENAPQNVDAIIAELEALATEIDAEDVSKERIKEMKDKIHDLWKNARAKGHVNLIKNLNEKISRFLEKIDKLLSGADQAIETIEANGAPGEFVVKLREKLAELKEDFAKLNEEYASIRAEFEGADEENFKDVAKKLKRFSKLVVHKVRKYHKFFMVLRKAAHRSEIGAESGKQFNFVEENTEVEEIEVPEELEQDYEAVDEEIESAEQEDLAEDEAIEIQAEQEAKEEITDVVESIDTEFEEGSSIT